MDLGNVEMKIREAEFFLDRMRDFEKRPMPVGEHFYFYLSAFLGASRAVDARLHHEHEASYDSWRRKWSWTNGPADDLIRFFSADQSVEVRGGGSKEDEKKQEGESTTTVIGPPGIFPLAGGGKRDYFFKIDGVAHGVTDACAEYVKVLKRMVVEFKAAHS